jgi:hypothetical protein
MEKMPSSAATGASSMGKKRAPYEHFDGVSTAPQFGSKTLPHTLSVSRRCVLLIDVVRVTPAAPDDLALSYLDALVALHTALERSMAAHSCRMTPSIGEEMVVLTTLAMSEEAELLALLRVAKDISTMASAVMVSWVDASHGKKAVPLPVHCVVCCGAVYEAYTADNAKGEPLHLGSLVLGLCVHVHQLLCVCVLGSVHACMSQVICSTRNRLLMPTTIH